MQREDLTDLSAFVAVAEEGGFTKAAGRIGVSQSALSHAVRRLETRLGVRLLHRTTRSVAPTSGGERLLSALRPAFDGIDDALASLSELRATPAGSVRITTAQHAADTIILPALLRLMPRYPDVKVEVVVDYSLTDIVAERFDAGVRLGEQLAKDMVAVRIGPDLRMAVVAAPAYLAARGAPSRPQELADHDCINLRLPTLGGMMAWDFERRGRQLKVRVDGQLAFNRSEPIVAAAVAGLGVAYVPEDMVTAYLADGRLQRVLESWCEPFSGYHLYYPSRRQVSPALKVLVDALRYRR